VVTRVVNGMSLGKGQGRGLGLGRVSKMGCTVSLMLALELEASGIGDYPECRRHMVMRVVNDRPLRKGQARGWGLDFTQYCHY